jgi:hypothetical protein
VGTLSLSPPFPLLSFSPSLPPPPPPPLPLSFSLSISLSFPSPSLSLSLAERRQGQRESGGRRGRASARRQEYKRRSLGREPQQGTLEMMGQTAVLTWPEELVSAGPGARPFSALRREPLIFGSRFMAHNDASTIFQALEDALPPLQFDRLLELAEHVPLVVLSLGGDLDGANVRCKHHYAKMAGEHNEAVRSGRKASSGYVAIADVVCLGHILHRTVEVCFRVSDLIGKLHATAFTCNDPKMYRTLTGALRQLVRTDLDTGFFPGQRPLPAWRAHSQQVIDLTLTRSRHTRARSDLEAPVQDDELDDMSDRLLAICNGLSGTWKRCACVSFPIISVGRTAVQWKRNGNADGNIVLSETLSETLTET